MRFFVLAILVFFLASLHAEDLMSSQLADQARQWHEKGRDDLAADLWRKILRADPKHAEAKARLADIDNPVPAGVPLPRPPSIETKKPPETPKSQKSREKTPPDLMPKNQEKPSRTPTPPKSTSPTAKQQTAPNATQRATLDVAKEKAAKREVIRGRTTLDARSFSLPTNRSIAEPQAPSLGIGPVLSPLSPNTAPIPALVTPALPSQPASAVNTNPKR